MGYKTNERRGPQISVKEKDSIHPAKKSGTGKHLSTCREWREVNSCG
jgi:hypothetical protein